MFILKEFDIGMEYDYDFHVAFPHMNYFVPSEWCYTWIGAFPLFRKEPECLFSVPQGEEVPHIDWIFRTRYGRCHSFTKIFSRFRKKIGPCSLNVRATNVIALRAYILAKPDRLEFDSSWYNGQGGYYIEWK